MKFKPRRRSFVFFALILVAVVFYTIHVLSSMDLDESASSSFVDYKSEVERLRNQIQFLEKKASENEHNYKNLEKIYRQLEEAKRREGGENGGRADEPSENREVIQAPDVVPEHKKPEQTSAVNKFFTKLFIDREEKAYAQQCEWFQEHKPSASDISVSFGFGFWFSDLYVRLLVIICRPRDSTRS